ncbi:MAG TPA: hypothetical protein V6D30_01470 [Leptolyngbyaceae cyanobacterium]
MVQLQPVVEMTDEQFYEFSQINRDLRIEPNAKGELLIRPMMTLAPSTTYLPALQNPSKRPCQNYRAPLYHTGVKYLGKLRAALAPILHLTSECNDLFDVSLSSQYNLGCFILPLES